MLERKLTAKGVTFQVAIDPEYRDLIHGDSKFVVNSRLDVKGARRRAGAGRQRQRMGERRDQGDPGRKGKMQSSYPLYANLKGAGK